MVSASRHCETPKVQGRESGSFHGAGFCTDESTPNSRHFSRYRFQVTWVYFLLFADVDRWESPVYDAQYPFSRRRCICGICHVPLKTGAETLKVIESKSAA